jgi:AsmA protein
MRKALMIAGGVVLVLLVAVIALAMLIDADQFRPTVEKQASDGLGRQVTLGKLKLALLQGGVSAEKLTIADDPQFSSEAFLTADSMSIGVNLRALIFDRKLIVESFLIHAPRLNLVQNQQGHWNYESLGAKSAQTSTPAGTPEFLVSKFALDNGQVTVHHPGSSKNSEYSKLHLEATDVSPTSTIPYQFSATVPGGGTVEAKGTIGPMAQQSERTPMSAMIKVRDFDIAATGFSDPSSPLKGLLDVDADAKSDGVRTTVAAKITGKKMCLAAGCTPATTPIGLDVQAGYLLADRMANLSNSLLKFGNSAAKITGTVDLKPAKPQVNARIDATNLAVKDIESVLPALGVVLPPGARLEGGTASVKATAVGPADALLIKGHVGLLNSKVTGYDLGSKMAAVTKLSGVSVGKETMIQEFASDVQQSNAGSKIDNLLLVLPGIGKLTGAGTVGRQNELNFAMKAQVDVSKGAIGQISTMLGRKNTNMGIPFRITGTTKDPKFTPEMGSALGAAAAGGASQVLGGAATKGTGITGTGVEGLTKGLGGLFGKKPQ